MRGELPSVDMGSVGEAASKMPDPQTVMFYFLLVLIVVLVMKDIVGGWRHSRTVDRFGKTSESLSVIMKDDALQLMAQLNLLEVQITTARQERQAAAEEGKNERAALLTSMDEILALLEQRK